MDKIIIAYWSQTGNTKEMALAVAKGVEGAGKKALVLEISKVSLDDLKEADVFALGCPSMGSEVLEETEMEPFMMEVEKFISGKKIGLFGSYGWGDGEWMRDWEERISKAGATVLGGAGVIAQEAPDNVSIEACKQLGEALANS